MRYGATSPFHAACRLEKTVTDEPIELSARPRVARADAVSAPRALWGTLLILDPARVLQTVPHQRVDRDVGGVNTGPWRTSHRAGCGVRHPARL